MSYGLLRHLIFAISLFFIERTHLKLMKEQGSDISFGIQLAETLRVSCDSTEGSFVDAFCRYCYLGSDVYRVPKGIAAGRGLG
ncbi:hypothetical protein P5V15_012598 [Pogonomyrmex californicus]